MERSELKEEALQRMKALDLHYPCIRAFKAHDSVWTSEFMGGLFEKEDVQERVKAFEAEHGGLVYHVIHTPTEFGDLYSMLYVSEHKEEWEYDRSDINDGCAVAYVWNDTEPMFSEFGSIGIRPSFGGLVRTY